MGRFRKCVISTVFAVGAVAPGLVAVAPASAYTPWACGTAKHSHGSASGSAALTSSTQGCGLKVVVDCKSGGNTQQKVGSLVYTGNTSTANCSPGYIWKAQGHQMGTNW